jgi:glycosyltransferase involved in cell wall biosynthesis
MDVVSVIVPVYNVEKYLERCVQSILTQTYSALEIILVDDGAQDQSPLICDQLAMQDKRIKIIHQANQGLGYARNTGLKHATGQYVTFIDSDDYIGKTHIENLYRALCDQNADIAMGFYSTVNDHGVVSSRESKLKHGFYDKTRLNEEILMQLVGTDENCKYDTVVESSCCMNLYRLSIINEHNIWFVSEKEAVAEDQFFNIDYLTYANSVVVTQVNDYFYYENPKSISRQYDKKRFGRTVNYYHVLCQKVHAHGIANIVGNRIERSFLMKTRVALRHISLSDLDFASKKNEIRKILYDELLQKVVQEYPIERYAAPMKILMIFMRKKCVLGVYFMLRIREYIRKIAI